MRIKWEITEGQNLNIRIIPMESWGVEDLEIDWNNKF